MLGGFGAVAIRAAGPGHEMADLPVEKLSMDHQNGTFAVEKPAEYLTKPRYSCADWHRTETWRGESTTYPQASAQIVRFPGTSPQPFPQRRTVKQCVKRRLEQGLPTGEIRMAHRE